MIQNAIFLKDLFHMNLHMMLIYYFPYIYMHNAVPVLYCFNYSSFYAYFKLVQ